MNKILYVSNTANFSKFNKPFMRWCKNQGWQVDYCAPNDEIIGDCDKHIILPIPRSPFSRGIFNCIKQLKKILNEEQYDIIHCHTPMGSVIARLAAKKLYKENKTKIIYTAHGFHFYKGAPLINWCLYYPIEKFLTKYTNVIITINKEDYQFALKKFSKNCEVLFMNGVGVNLSKFSPITKEESSVLREKYGYSDSDFIITNVAELNKNKNQAFLINALPILKKEIPNLKVCFLGKESKPYARILANKLNLNDTCSFLGYRQDADLFEKMSDICFSASIREGLPVNIIESMACGKVCICSNNRGHNSLITNDETGLIFNLNNKQQMVNDILKIYNNKDFAINLEKKALEASKQYDIEKAIEFTADLYNKINK